MLVILVRQRGRLDSVYLVRRRLDSLRLVRRRLDSLCLVRRRLDSLCLVRLLNDVLGSVYTKVRDPLLVFSFSLWCFPV